MKTFVEYITEKEVYTNHLTWEANAKNRGLEIMKQTHPSGVGHHFVAKDKEGNHRGQYDPQKQSGNLFQGADDQQRNNKDINAHN